MPPRTTGNGIPNWPTALRRAALRHPASSATTALARAWRARPPEYPAPGSRPVALPAHGVPGSTKSSNAGRPANATSVEITIAPAMSSGCRS